MPVLSRIPAASASADIALSAASVQARRGRATVVAKGAAGAVFAPPVSAIHFSSSTKSRTDCQRSSGDLARHLRTTRSRAAGASGETVEIGDGSACMIAPIRLACDFPSNARLPASISYSTQPNAKMSVRASAWCPSICSGAMYWNVPTIAPWAVIAGGVVSAMLRPPELCTEPVALASPKSSSFAPVFVSMTLPGLRSRCTRPARCAAASASPTWMAIASAS